MSGWVVTDIPFWSVERLLNYPETPISLNYGIIPKVLVGSLVRLN